MHALQQISLASEWNLWTTSWTMILMIMTAIMTYYVTFGACHVYRYLQSLRQQHHSFRYPTASLALPSSEAPYHFEDTSMAHERSLSRVKESTPSQAVITTMDSDSHVQFVCESPRLDKSLEPENIHVGMIVSAPGHVPQRGHPSSVAGVESAGDLDVNSPISVACVEDEPSSKSEAQLPARPILEHDEREVPSYITNTSSDSQFNVGRAIAADTAQILSLTAQLSDESQVPRAPIDPLEHSDDPADDSSANLEDSTADLNASETTFIMHSAVLVQDDDSGNTAQPSAMSFDPSGEGEEWTSVDHPDASTPCPSSPVDAAVPSSASASELETKTVDDDDLSFSTVLLTHSEYLSALAPNVEEKTFSSPRSETLSTLVNPSHEINVVASTPFLMSLHDDLDWRPVPSGSVIDLSSPVLPMSPTTHGIRVHTPERPDWAVATDEDEATRRKKERRHSVECPDWAVAPDSLGVRLRKSDISGLGNGNGRRRGRGERRGWHSR